MVPAAPAGFLVPRRTQDPAASLPRFAYGALTLFGRLPCRSAALPFFFCGPTTPARGLVWPPSGFARRYSRNHFCSLFLRVLRCFTSPGSPPFRDASPLRDAGFPIRTPPDPRSPTAPRRVSPFDASFFSGTCLGIRRTPFLS